MEDVGSHVRMSRTTVEFSAEVVEGGGMDVERSIAEGGRVDTVAVVRKVEGHIFGDCGESESCEEAVVFEEDGEEKEMVTLDGGVVGEAWGAESVGTTTVLELIQESNALLRRERVHLRENEHVPKYER